MQDLVMSSLLLPLQLFCCFIYAKAILQLVSIPSLTFARVASELYWNKEALVATLWKGYLGCIKDELADLWIFMWRSITADAVTFCVFNVRPKIISCVTCLVKQVGCAVPEFILIIQQLNPVCYTLQFPCSFPVLSMCIETGSFCHVNPGWRSV